jgi:putative ABC transport system substrate-binding protein
MSYGTNLAEMFRELGVCGGNVLKGTRPADLPVPQSTKFEFVINATTAKAFGLAIPAAVISSLTKSSNKMHQMSAFGP